MPGTTGRWADWNDAMEQARRDLLKSIAMGGAAAVALAAGGRLLAQEPGKPSATPPKLAPPWTPGPHKNVALGFDVKKRQGLSATLLPSPHATNYAGAVPTLTASQRAPGSAGPCGCFLRVCRRCVRALTLGGHAVALLVRLAATAGARLVPHVLLRLAGPPGNNCLLAAGRSVG